MGDRVVTETFFRPEAVASRPWRMPSGVYRSCQRLLRRTDRSCVFVPIRSMQFQAVVDRREVVFVDALGGYVVQDGQGGRVILLSWRPAAPGELVSLAEPVPCEVIHYRPGLDPVQRRLVGEFTRALGGAEARSGRGMPRGARSSPVVPLRPRA